MGGFFCFENGLSKILIFGNRLFALILIIHQSTIIYFLSYFIKIKHKIVFSVTDGLVSTVYCLWARGTKKPSHMLGFFCMSRSLVFTFLHCATLVLERRIFVSFHLCICKNNTYWLVDNIVGCINFLYIASYVLCKNNSAIHKSISIIFMNRQMK